MKPLQIADIVIRRDAFGRYCLSDVHKAAMLLNCASNSQRPGNYLRLTQAQELMHACQFSHPNDAPISARLQGAGRTSWTFAQLPFLHSYALWLDPYFYLTLLDAMERSTQPKPSIGQRLLAWLGCAA